MGSFPGDTDTSNSMQNNNMKNPRSNYNQQKYSNSSSDADRHFPYNSDKSNNTSSRPSSAGNNGESIPIRVVYTQQPKNKYSSDARNTTDLPVRGQSNLEPPSNDFNQGESSPRLERAHSEPPKTFNQKLRASNITPGGGGWVVPGTIPENAESCEGQEPRVGNQAPFHQQNYNLSEPHNNLATSASAPSVPSHKNRPSTAPPAAPPRRSVPTRVNMNTEPPPQDDVPAVRHIPIFVEGRDEPVFNKKLSNTESSQRKTSDGKSADDESSGIRKPSDFYPGGTKKVSRGTTRPSNLDVNQQFSQEPTSPLSPPEGPIPMGYDPNVNFEPQKQEPTSPQPPPPGPIPMGFNPNLIPQSSQDNNPIQQVSSPENNASKDIPDASIDSGNVSRKTSTEPAPKQEGVFIVPISVQGDDESNSAKIDSIEKKEEAKPSDPALDKLKKVKDAVAGLVAEIESYTGSKEDKEYRYLDEMLTRHLLTLDSIETGGRDDIRQMRKDTIRSINRCASILDSRASGKQGKDAADNNAILDELAAKSSAEYQK